MFIQPEENIVRDGWLARSPQMFTRAYDAVRDESSPVNAPVIHTGRSFNQIHSPKSVCALEALE